MDCKQCTENLTAFLDGELQNSELAQMRLHLDICLSCAHEFSSLKEAADFIESHHKDLAPRLESWPMVRARLSTADSSPWFHFFAPNRWQIATASLVVFAALGIGQLLYQQFQKRNLENYMTQYIHDRESRSWAQSVQWNAGANSQVGIPYEVNPFIEIRASYAANPFSSELSSEEE